MTKFLSPEFFALSDICAIQGRSWIPLRQNGEIEHESPFEGIGDIREYTGIATLAVASADRGAVDGFSWSEVDTSAHRPTFDGGVYRPADVQSDWNQGHKAVGTHLVLAQARGGWSPEIWHLHHDLVIALKLEREGDVWLRPDEGWIEVARLKRDEEDRPVLLEIRAEMLSDYLVSRDMVLFASSYHERSANFIAKPPYEWADEHVQSEAGRDTREKYIRDVEFLSDRGHKFRGLGALWRTEWFEPGAQSIRVRGDPEADEVSFAVGPDGERKTAAQCIGAMTYIAFQPSLVPALLRYRGGSLGWYSRDTGGIAGGETGIHFGVNALGLITIFAKDIAKLDGWEQRVWAAHSTPLDGGVPGELWDTQMNCKPAGTQAPEAQIRKSLDALDDTFQERFGASLLREHDSIPMLLRRTHRFRAIELDGLLSLAKELNRLLMERVDMDALRGPAGLTAKDKLGTLKAMEKLLEQSLGQADARAMMAPLFGINDLRNADAHLGSSLVESGLRRANVDQANANPVDQGRQLLETFVDTLRAITATIAPAVAS
ncbi:MAG TPA: hypothetical protein VJM09_15305 [Sphingobium sp.]|nr:hypothetical protein [Sphingobium sp.]